MVRRSFVNTARGLKFRIKVEEGLYYPYSENKGADQLRGHREADLRFCFRICKKPVFSRQGSADLGLCLSSRFSHETAQTYTL